MRESMLRPGQAVPAAATGAYLGTGRSGPFAVRLFRPVPTRVVVCSGGFAAQLLTMRAALSGTPVRVVSDRPSSWAPVLQHGADARLVPDDSPLLHQRGPMVVVDDRPDERRPLREVADWQCLFDLRTVRSGLGADAARSLLSSYARADVVALGTVDPHLADALARVFGLDDATRTRLAAGLPPQTVAMVTRGRAELVRVDATANEAQVLRSAVLHSAAR